MSELIDDDFRPDDKPPAEAPRRSNLQSLPEAWVDGRRPSKDASATGGSEAAQPGGLRVGVVFATRGRPGIVTRSVRALSQQTRPPDLVMVSCADAADVAPLREDKNITVLFGPPGLARQRNRAMRAMPPDVDLVLFFDDDFVAHRTWIEVVERCFVTHPEIVAVTGHVLRDGIKGPGLSFEEAALCLDGWTCDTAAGLRDRYSPYGCNMGFRRSAVRDLWFDERLVLYGWLEDRDFGGALARRGGRLVQLGSAVGVHLGVKAGRLSGHRLGYSQVVNPIYLYRKGTMSIASLTVHLFKNLTSNLVRSLAPEAHIDRVGRLRGNLIGIRDVLSGCLTPERAERL